MSRLRVSAAITIAAAAALLTGCGGRNAGVGPLAASVTYASAVGVPVPIGTPYSFGIPLINPTGRPMTIDRVLPVGQQQGIVVAGIRVAHHPKAMINSAIGYPPKESGVPLRPPTGWVVAPHENEDDLIIGLRMTHAGVAVIRMFRIEYHSGSSHYAVDLPFTAQECAPLSRYPHGCPQPTLPG